MIKNVFLVLLRVRRAGGRERGGPFPACACRPLGRHAWTATDTDVVIDSRRAHVDRRRPGPPHHAFSALCDDCLRERGLADTHGHVEPEQLEDAWIEGDLPLDCDSTTGECRRGHPYRVVREGSEGSRH